MVFFFVVSFLVFVFYQKYEKTSVAHDIEIKRNDWY